MGLPRKAVAFVLFTTLLAPAEVLAQADPARLDSPTMSATDPEPTVSLERIRRGLALKARTRESHAGLRLEYYIEVYGQAPRLELFTPEENVSASPVMYGGMTHQEFLDVVKPEAFKSPPADLLGALLALIKAGAEKKIIRDKK